MMFDINAFADAFSKELRVPLQRILDDSRNTDYAERIATFTQTRLKKSLRSALAESSDRSADIETNVTLTTSLMKASEVTQLGLAQMSISQLYRATEQGRFYFVMPRGKANGRLFPAWQFLGRSPDLLPPVLARLRGMGETNLHMRLVEEVSSVSALSIAELLTGLPFQSRRTVEYRQRRILKLKEQARIDMIDRLLLAS